MHTHTRQREAARALTITSRARDLGTCEVRQPCIIVHVYKTTRVKTPPPRLHTYYCSNHKYICAWLLASVNYIPELNRERTTTAQYSWHGPSHSPALVGYVPINPSTPCYIYTHEANVSARANILYDLQAGLDWLIM